MSNLNCKKFEPLVTIIIPVYNGENFLEKAIVSAINQIYKNIEIIVVDDGSTDSTEIICNKYKNKIKYIKKNNGGVSTALNIGIKNSKGTYISWLSHDDEYLDNKISSQVTTLNNLENKNSIIFSNYSYINSKSKKTKDIDYKKIINFNKNYKYLLLYGQLITGCSLLIPKILFNKYGLFNERLKYTQDYKKWFEFIHEDFIYSDVSNLYIRCHRNQGTNLYLRNSDEFEDLWLNALKYLDDYNQYSNFLGYEETLFFYYITFGKKEKINNFICNKINIKEINKKIIIKNIRKKILNFNKLTIKLLFIKLLILLGLFEIIKKIIKKN